MTWAFGIVVAPLPVDSLARGAGGGEDEDGDREEEEIVLLFRLWKKESKFISGNWEMQSQKANVLKT